MKRPTSRLAQLVVISAMLAPVGPVVAGDWEMFRGNAELSGVAEDALPQDPQPLWG